MAVFVERKVLCQNLTCSACSAGLSVSAAFASWSEGVLAGSAATAAASAAASRCAARVAYSGDSTWKKGEQTGIIGARTSYSAAA